MKIRWTANAAVSGREAIVIVFQIELNMYDGLVAVGGWWCLVRWCGIDGSPAKFLPRTSSLVSLPRVRSCQLSLSLPPYPSISRHIFSYPPKYLEAKASKVCLGVSSVSVSRHIFSSLPPPYLSLPAISFLSPATNIIRPRVKEIQPQYPKSQKSRSQHRTTNEPPTAHSRLLLD